MTYQETVNWMFRQLPMYQNQGAKAYKANLDNIKRLAAHLGHPEQHIKTIHIAGTNGKGSTCSMIASILQEAGYKTGLFTSPHLKDYRERIRINGEEIPEDYVCNFVEKNKSFLETRQLSFFEMNTGLAFDYFHQQKTDINIIEVGLGGRLDATNIITPLISVITSIGMDHTQFLGDTLPLIATEKAGIIKPGIPVVIGETLPETLPVFENTAQERKCPIYFADKLPKVTMPSDLTGEYQTINKKIVIQTLEILKSVYGYTIPQSSVESGLGNVLKNTGLKGRWQLLQQNPRVIADCAHNIHGITSIMRQLNREPYKELHVVLGFANDKDLESILPLFPKNARYYFCKPGVERGLPVDILFKKATAHQLKGTIHHSVTAAYQEALHTAQKEDLIFIGGSTFTVAEII